MKYTIKEYYDRSTRRFLRLGQGGREFAIHRAVWAPGVETSKAAIHYVDELIAERIRRETHAREVDGTRIIDLGCGVGGSIRYLDTRVSARFTGVTISRKQVSLGTKLLEDAANPVEIIDADMCEIHTRVPPGRPGTRTLCFAVESLVHLASPAALFDSLSRILVPGDTVMICDDFLSVAASVTDRNVAEFIRGWNAPGLHTSNEIRTIARAAGFTCEEEIDLTPYLELLRPRDRIIRLFVPILRAMSRFSPWFGSLVGGDALQRCLLDRSITYRFLVLRFRPD